MNRFSSFPLPDKAYLPGLTPRIDPPMPSLPENLDFEKDWPTLERYRFGLDCLNRDLGWECHEALEAIWHQVGRRETRGGQALQTLILLGSARVKILSGKNPSVLLRRASERILALEGRQLYGLDWRDVQEQILSLGENPHHIIKIHFSTESR